MPEISIDGSPFEFEGTILDAVMGMGKNPDSYLFLMGDRPVPSDLVPENGQKVKAIRVASGG